ncbi:tetratricopeptide repeat protein [Shouchella sp. 1P09AA]|uniref:tetratricopeptide repeat protein n=1 Tax=unclassified Shouchella TaxID=2893065 RepID=UPI0039A1748A
MLKEDVFSKIEAGNIEEALSMLASRSTSDDHQVRFEVAELYYELGHIKEARLIVEDLRALYPDEGSLAILSAEMMIDEDEEDEAIEVLLEVGVEDDSYAQAQLLLADLYQLQALDEVAEQKLLAALQKNPDEMILVYALGEFYLNQGAYNKAIPYLKQSLYADLGEVNVGLSLAEAYSGNGQFEDSLQLYHQQETNKMTPDQLFSFGFTAYQQGDYPVVIEQLGAVKSLDADFTSVYMPLAKAYEAENRLDEAFETLKDGIRMDEFNDQLPMMAGQVLTKMNDLVGAEQFFRQSLALNPSNVKSVQAFAALLKDEERADDLDELIQYVQEHGESDPLLTWFQAFAKAHLEEFEEARLLYKEAMPSFNEDADFLIEYGYFLLEEGDRKQAKSLLEQALLLDPTRSDLPELIEELNYEE